MAASAWGMVGFLVLLGLAAWQDLRSRQVNAWTLAGMLFWAITLRLSMGGLEAWIWAVVWFGLGLFLRSWIGSADVLALSAMGLVNPILPFGAWLGAMLWWAGRRFRSPFPALPGFFLGALVLTIASTAL